MYWHGLATLVRTAGLPFILFGDWQVEPPELEASGFLRLVGGVTVATDEPTNVQTGRILDYYVISEELEPLVIDIKAMVGSRLATHLPVILRMKGARSIGETRRIAQPRTHPPYIPQGPMPAGIAIGWSSSTMFAENAVDDMDA